MGKKIKGLNLVLEIAALVGLIFQLALIIFVWNILPEVIPIHFDFAGDVDQTGSKTDLLLLAGLSVLFYIGLTWLGYYPEKFNYPWKINPNERERQYSLARKFIRLIKAESVWIFAVISFQVVAVAFGKINKLSPILIALIVFATSATVIGYLSLALRNDPQYRR
ncbi:MAG: DUF1648 domain-containing protein [Acidobacteriota bacterium]|jgi:uncharacterized membrane protein